VLANACYLLRHWDEQPLLILQRRGTSLAGAGGVYEDKVQKSSFFQRVHLTGLWMEARYPATPAYGVVGMQIGVFELGRVTLPAVGVMVVVTKDGNGGHIWKPATTLGFGYRICNFVAPFIGRQASLHFNVATAHLPGAGAVGAERGVSNLGTVNLFGLSVSATRRR
jgi:hypothetical protein